ncbi:unnamed protein product [Moneuplotes crassus]|uniref:Uncharacterized protein n=1 Tax=Euplotes crassus TaxID=5936 RepID=A0AAD1Y7G8_EUPCR|nr:unnamed protein product [Moneuplotes crassus]
MVDPSKLSPFMSDLNLKHQKRELLTINLHKLRKIEKSMLITKQNSSKLEEQGEILLKHESLVRNAVLNQALEVKLNIFKTEVQKSIDNKLEEFVVKFFELLSAKVDASSFKKSLDKKASKEALKKTDEQVFEVFEKMELFNQYLEKQRKDEEENRNPMQNEIDRLDNDKADQLEFIELQQKVADLKKIVDSFDEEDSEDEFDEEDSVEEDVLSLHQSGENENMNSNSEGENQEDQLENPELERESGTSSHKNNSSQGENLPSSLVKPIIEEDSALETLKPETEMSSVSPASSPANSKKRNKVKLDSQKEIHLKDEDEDSPVIKPVKIEIGENSRRDRTPDPAPSTSKLQTSNKNVSLRKDASQNQASQDAKNSTVADKESSLNFSNTKESFNKAGLVKQAKMQRKETESTVRSKAGLRRMNSRVSIVSSRKKGPGAGLKIKIEELNKKIQIWSFNLEKALEDFKIMKTQQAQRHQRFKEMDELVEYLQKNYDKWLEEHQDIICRQNQLDSQYKRGITDISEKYSKISKIFKEGKKMIEANRKEFKDGFERIIRCEVHQHEDRRRIKILQNKAKENMLSKDLPSDKLERLHQSYTEDIDGKFEILYSQINKMATDQADFNLKIKQTVDKLDAPMKKQMEAMIKENESMHIELERSQNHNREILTSCGFLGKKDKSRVSKKNLQLSNFKRKKSLIKRTAMKSIGSTSLNLTSLSFGKSKPEFDLGDPQQQISFHFDSYMPMTKRNKRTSPITYGSNKSKVKLFRPSESNERKSFDMGSLSNSIKIPIPHE